MMRLFLLSILVFTTATSEAQLMLSFPSRDSLTVTADWYPVSSDMPVILLCHQNRFSRGEYRETALKLNKYGFNCMAVDLRVGDEAQGVKNETAQRAKEDKKRTEFADAEQDMLAALDYLYEKYNRRIILF